MNPFVYQPGNSMLHRTDAVTKVVWLLAVTITVVLISSLAIVLGLFMLVLLTGLILGQLRVSTLSRRLMFPAIMSIWLFLFLAIFTGSASGEPVVAFGPFQVTAESLRYGGALGLRILTLATASTVYVLTTDPRRMIEEFITFGGLPYRAGFAIYAALRFLPLLQTEARTIRHAHAVRADVSADGRGFRLSEIRKLTIPLLSGALRRVQTTAVAMDSRGFGAHKVRTVIDDLKRYPPGTVIVVTQLCLLALALYLQFAVGFGTEGFLRSPVSGGDVDIGGG